MQVFLSLITIYLFIIIESKLFSELFITYASESYKAKLKYYLAQATLEFSTGPGISSDDTVHQKKEIQP